MAVVPYNPTLSPLARMQARGGSTIQDERVSVPPGRIDTWYKQFSDLLPVRSPLGILVYATMMRRITIVNEVTQGQILPAGQKLDFVDAYFIIMEDTKEVPVTPDQDTYISPGTTISGTMELYQSQIDGAGMMFLQPMDERSDVESRTMGGKTMENFFDILANTPYYELDTRAPIQRIRTNYDTYPLLMGVIQAACHHLDAVYCKMANVRAYGKDSQISLQSATDLKLMTPTEAMLGTEYVVHYGDPRVNDVIAPNIKELVDAVNLGQLRSERDKLQFVLKDAPADLTYESAYRLAVNIMRLTLKQFDPWGMVRNERSPGVEPCVPPQATFVSNWMLGALGDKTYPATTLLPSQMGQRENGSIVSYGTLRRMTNFVYFTTLDTFRQRANQPEEAIIESLQTTYAAMSMVSGLQFYIEALDVVTKVTGISGTMSIVSQILMPVYCLLIVPDLGAMLVTLYRHTLGNDVRPKEIYLPDQKFYQVRSVPKMMGISIWNQYVVDDENKNVIVSQEQAMYENAQLTFRDTAMELLYGPATAVRRLITLISNSITFDAWTAIAESVYAAPYGGREQYIGFGQDGGDGVEDYLGYLASTGYTMQTVTPERRALWKQRYEGLFSHVRDGHVPMTRREAFRVGFGPTIHEELIAPGSQYITQGPSTRLEPLEVRPGTTLVSADGIPLIIAENKSGLMRGYTLDEIRGFQADADMTRRVFDLLEVQRVNTMTQQRLVTTLHGSGAVVRGGRLAKVEEDQNLLADHYVESITSWLLSDLENSLAADGVNTMNAAGLIYLADVYFGGIAPTSLAQINRRLAEKINIKYTELHVVEMLKQKRELQQECARQLQIAEESYDELQAAVTRYEQAIEKDKETIGDLVKKMDELTSALSAAQEYADRWSSFKEQLIEQGEDIEEDDLIEEYISNVIQELRSRVNEQEDAIENYERSLQDAQTTISNQQTEAERLRAQAARTQAQLRDVRREVQLFENPPPNYPPHQLPEVRDAQQAANIANQLLTDERRTTEQQREELNRLRQREADLNAEIGRYSREIDVIQTNVVSLESTISSMRNNAVAQQVASDEAAQRAQNEITQLQAKGRDYDALKNEVRQFALTAATYQRYSRQLNDVLQGVESGKYSFGTALRWATDTHKRIIEEIARNPDRVEIYIPRPDPATVRLDELRMRYQAAMDAMGANMVDMSVLAALGTPATQQEVDEAGARTPRQSTRTRQLGEPRMARRGQIRKARPVTAGRKPDWWSRPLGEIFNERIEIAKTARNGRTMEAWTWMMYQAIHNSIKKKSKKRPRELYVGSYCRN